MSDPPASSGARLPIAGDVVVVLFEAEDLGVALAGMGDSDLPFDKWFRQHCLRVHGIDLAGGFPPPDQILDFRA